MQLFQEFLGNVIVRLLPCRFLNKLVGGNLILDVHFKEIGKSLERDIKAITGVIESGLFWGRDVEILVA